MTNRDGKSINEGCLPIVDRYSCDSNGSLLIQRLINLNLPRLHVLSASSSMMMKPSVAFQLDELDSSDHELMGYQRCSQHLPAVFLVLEICYHILVDIKPKFLIPKRVSFTPMLLGGIVRLPASFFVAHAILHLLLRHDQLIKIGRIKHYYPLNNWANDAWSGV